MTSTVLDDKPMKTVQPMKHHIKEAYIVFGSTGMLGQYASRHLSLRPNAICIAVKRSDCDLKSESSIRAHLDGIKARICEQIQNDESFQESSHEDTETNTLVVYIINCAGVIRQRVNTCVDEMYKINAEFPMIVHQWCMDNNEFDAKKACCIEAKIRFHLIQISTDCVFSGEIQNDSELNTKDQNIVDKEQNQGENTHNQREHAHTDTKLNGLKSQKNVYLESDICDGEDVYAKSKRACEILLLMGSAKTNDICDKDKTIETKDIKETKDTKDTNMNCVSIIRTSIIGEETNNKLGLLEWCKINTKLPEQSIFGYQNLWWNGVTCLQLVKYIISICAKRRLWSGVRHYFSPTVCSKYSLLVMIKETFGGQGKVQASAAAKSNSKVLGSQYSTDTAPSLLQQLQELKIDGNKIYSR